MINNTVVIEEANVEDVKIDQIQELKSEFQTYKKLQEDKNAMTFGGLIAITLLGGWGLFLMSAAMWDMNARLNNVWYLLFPWLNWFS